MTLVSSRGEEREIARGDLLVGKGCALRRCACDETGAHLYVTEDSCGERHARCTACIAAESLWLTAGVPFRSARSVLLDEHHASAADGATGGALLRADNDTETTPPMKTTPPLRRKQDAVRPGGTHTASTRRALIVNGVPGALGAREEVAPRNGCVRCGVGGGSEVGSVGAGAAAASTGLPAALASAMPPGFRDPKDILFEVAAASAAAAVTSHASPAASTAPASAAAAPPLPPGFRDPKDILFGGGRTSGLFAGHPVRRRGQYWPER